MSKALMDTNKMREMREAFERTNSRDHRRQPPKGNNYIDPMAQADWESFQKGWQASREAVAVGLPGLTDELLTAAYWDFDARRKGYPPYAAPAGQECSAFKVAIVGAIEAQGLKVEVKP
ncbi:hypothetical protein [Pseudomonas putida]|uniref:hypothetical protein n=1 Tax=Pseudomonas putida TaxID=303 RepID=UPI000CD47095|nr:hypothetical protein [Pseudomonas putida]POF93210.1 hypothetical protein BGP83_11110 [Pseudomonas putida]